MENETVSVNIENADLQNIAAYHDDRLAIIDNPTNERLNKSVRINAFIAILCLHGTGTICINGETYNVQKNDLIIYHPNAIISDSDISQNLEIRCICLSQEYIKQLFSIAQNPLEARLFFEQNPILHLLTEEAELFCQYYNLLRIKLTCPPYKNQRKVTNALLLAFLYEFRNVVDHFISIQPINYSSAGNICHDFIELLSNSFPKKRMVADYADQLHITPKYLSAVCKATMGKTASDIINQYVVKDIIYLLKQPHKSIKEIANELDFPNLSFFGKYVRKHLGASPTQYRNANERKDEV